MVANEPDTSDLSTRLRHRLRTPTDAIAQDLVTEARSIRAFLDGATTGLPWAPQLNDPAGNKAIVEDLEERTRELQLAVATILLNDHEGTFTDALIRTLKMLAKATEVPTGVQYNRIGAALRYYPLGLILYTVFVCGVAANRGDLLKKVLAVPLRHRERNMVAPITEIFFFWYEARALFNDAFGQQWCEPLAQRIRQVVGDHIGEMLDEYSEAESFFRGEFVLALTNIDLGMTEGKSAEQLMPLPGLYLYSREVYDPLAGFLLEYPKWLDELYGHPVGEILDAFDRNASKIAVSNCLPLGLIGLKTSAIYQESLQKRR